MATPNIVMTRIDERLVHGQGQLLLLGAEVLHQVRRDFPQVLVFHQKLPVLGKQLAG